MKALFLISALALPALPQSTNLVFDELVKMFERDFDHQKTLVLIHRDIPLLNKDAEPTGFIFQGKYRVWVKGAA